MHYTTRLMVVMAIVCGPSISGAPAFQTASPPAKPAAGQPAKPTAGPPPKAASDNRLTTLGGLTVDYPKKDWDVLVGAGSALVVFAHRSNEATVAIEKKIVKRPLAANDITDQTASFEIEDWQARRPLSSNYAPQFLDISGARSILVDFKQPGPKGPEHVRMYTIPRGLDWYRVICITTQTAFDRHKETCHRMALSLTPAPSQ